MDVDCDVPKSCPCLSLHARLESLVFRTGPRKCWSLPVPAGCPLGSDWGEFCSSIHLRPSWISTTLSATQAATHYDPCYSNVHYIEWSYWPRAPATSNPLWPPVHPMFRIWNYALILDYFLSPSLAMLVQIWRSSHPKNECSEAGLPLVSKARPAKSEQDQLALSSADSPLKSQPGQAPHFGTLSHITDCFLTQSHHKFESWLFDRGSSLGYHSPCWSSGVRASTAALHSNDSSEILPYYLIGFL